MLEDLFFDALSNFTRMHSPKEVINRPPRGEKGFDYEFNGTPISHKVSKAGPLEIAALWDATRVDVQHWDFSTSICFTSGGYNSTSFKATFDDDVRNVTCKPLSKVSSIDQKMQLALVHWPVGNSCTVLATWSVDPRTPSPAAKALEFPRVWNEATIAHSSSIPANELEILVFDKRVQAPIGIGRTMTVHSNSFRPGVYLLDRKWLQAVPIKRNNRALLVPKHFVREVMDESRKAGLHVPLSDWFSSYSGHNPPDLYLAQRNEYDLMFASSATWSGIAISNTPTT